MLELPKVLQWLRLDKNAEGTGQGMESRAANQRRIGMESSAKLSGAGLPGISQGRAEKEEGLGDKKRVVAALLFESRDRTGTTKA